MGQRLTIQIVYEETPLVVSYEHWSGYTYPAIYRALVLLQHFRDAEIDFNNCDPTERQKFAVLTLKNVLEALHGAGPDTKAGIIADDIVYSLNKFGKDFTDIIGEATNRNTGLLAVSAQELAALYQAGEASVSIFIDTLTADISSVFYWIDEKECRETTNLRIVHLDYSIIEDDQSIEELSEIVELIEETMENEETFAVCEGSDSYLVSIY